MTTCLRATLLLLAATGCYRSLRSYPDSGVTGSAGDGAGGDGGTVVGGGGNAGRGQAGASGGDGGTSSGSGGSVAGTAGRGGNPGVIFSSGPCVVATGPVTREVFSRASDGRIYRRPFDGSNWGAWSNLAGLEGKIDARSDLDCSATLTTVHIVGTGINPVGGLLHAFGTGTSYNPFVRELSDSTFDPSPSIAASGDSVYSLAAVAYSWPSLHQSGDSYTPSELTPITTMSGSLRSGPDIAKQGSGGSSLTYFVAIDDTGAFVIYYWVINSGGFYWADPVKVSVPAGAFVFNPTICVENGGFGISSVNIAAVAAGRLWYARTDSISSPFSSWTAISDNVASSPDCAIDGPDSVAHVVAVNTAGSVIDVQGKGDSWVVTDLGTPP